jgi:hypothetical protein
VPAVVIMACRLGAVPAELRWPSMTAAKEAAGLSHETPLCGQPASYLSRPLSRQPQKPGCRWGVERTNA